MKFAIRVFSLIVVVAGVAAAATAPKAAPVVPSHQSATETMPVPYCGPHMGCPPQKPTEPTPGN